VPLNSCATANATGNCDSVSPAVSLGTSNVVARVGCAGSDISIDSAATAVSADSVAIHRFDPIRSVLTAR